MLQRGSQDPHTPAVAALLKLALQPLWPTFEVFKKKRSELRRKALRGCNFENTQLYNLLHSSPLTPDLFAQEVVDDIWEQASHQEKTVTYFLDFHPYFQRRGVARQARSQGRAKRQRRLQGSSG